MSVVYDELTGRIFSHDHPIDQVSSNPASGEVGQLILNTSDNTVYIYYAGSWQTLHKLNSIDKWWLENGDESLLESGDYALLESVTTTTDNNLALEG